MNWTPRIFEGYIVVLLGLLVFIAWKASSGGGSSRAEIWSAIYRLEVNQTQTQRAVERLSIGVSGVRDTVLVHEIRLNGFDKERLKRTGLFGR